MTDSAARPSLRLEAVLLNARDPGALAEFYRQAFALQDPRLHGADHVGFPIANSYLGFDRAAPGSPVGNGSITLWFQSTSVQADFDRLIHLGATPHCAPNEEMSPGEILAIVHDPEGNAIGLISPA